MGLRALPKHNREYLLQVIIRPCYDAEVGKREDGSFGG